MNIALGSDHRGTQVAQSLVNHLVAGGHSISVLGECAGQSCDYPDIAWQVCSAIRDGRADRGILICGTGIGMSIAANKMPGIRAGMAQDELAAQLSRSHNDANVLCLSADLIGQTLAKRMVDIFLSTPFEGGRHARRLGKIVQIERGEAPAGPHNGNG